MVYYCTRRGIYGEDTVTCLGRAGYLRYNTLIDGGWKRGGIVAWAAFPFLYVQYNTVVQDVRMESARFSREPACRQQVEAGQWRGVESTWRLRSGNKVIGAACTVCAAPPPRLARAYKTRSQAARARPIDYRRPVPCRRQSRTRPEPS